MQICGLAISLGQEHMHAVGLFHLSKMYITRISRLTPSKLFVRTVYVCSFMHPSSQVDVHQLTSVPSAGVATWLGAEPVPEQVPSIACASLDDKRANSWALSSHSTSAGPAHLCALIRAYVFDSLAVCQTLGSKACTQFVLSSLREIHNCPLGKERQISSTWCHTSATPVLERLRQEDELQNEDPS